MCYVSQTDHFDGLVRPRLYYLRNNVARRDASRYRLRRYRAVPRLWPAWHTFRHGLPSTFPTRHNSSSRRGKRARIAAAFDARSARPHRRRRREDRGRRSRSQYCETGSTATSSRSLRKSRSTVLCLPSGMMCKQLGLPGRRSGADCSIGIRRYHRVLQVTAIISATRIGYIGNPRALPR